MAKKKTKAKFSDTSQKEGLLTRQCPECKKFHHPRAGSCPACGHTYRRTRKKKASGKKAVKKKVPAANRRKGAGKEPLEAGIELVTACGNVKEARKVLDRIEQIKKL